MKKISLLFLFAISTSFVSMSFCDSLVENKLSIIKKKLIDLADAEVEIEKKKFLSLYKLTNEEFCLFMERQDLKAILQNKKNTRFKAPFWQRVKNWWQRLKNYFVPSQMSLDERRTHAIVCSIFKDYDPENIKIIDCEALKTACCTPILVEVGYCTGKCYVDLSIEYYKQYGQVELEADLRAKYWGVVLEHQFKHDALQYFAEIHSGHSAGNLWENSYQYYKALESRASTYAYVHSGDRIKADVYACVYEGGQGSPLFDFLKEHHPELFAEFKQ